MISLSNYNDPYNYKNYDFITEKAPDLKNDWIKYAKNNIDSHSHLMEIYKEINDFKKSIKIEKSIFEFALVFCKDNACNITMIPDVYHEKFNFIISNIKENPKINNNTLKKSILGGQSNLQFIAFLSPSQIHPENWKTYINKINFEEERENKLEYSDIYKCKKCGACKSSVTQKQSRCADEPPTTYVHCLVCNYGFKF
jgi:DNA-directed RNA polymerase subunit M/transcription elongation factor TFIIS